MKKIKNYEIISAYHHRRTSFKQKKLLKAGKTSR